jgi:predicted lactoylglutathione lyase
MAPSNPRKLFVNLAVRDLSRSKEFFSGLGFEFDPKFTNEQAACLVLNSEAFVMLLPETFFKSFTRRELADRTTQTETLLALACESRAEVDELVKKAMAAGGTRAMDAMDQGFMYSWSFYDLDGHHWEVFWMDQTSIA